MAVKSQEEIAIKELRRHFQSGYSNEIKEFVKERALVHSRYIWVLDRKDRQKGWCSYCRRDVIIKDGVKHNDEIKCPHCGRKVKVKHEWRGHSNLVDHSYFHYYEKSKLDPKIVVCRGIYVRNNFSVQDVKNVKTEYETHTFYVLEMGAPKMFTDYFHVWYDCPLQSLKKSVFPRFMNYAGLKNMNFEESDESLEEAAKGTAFKYSQWQEYMQNFALRSDNLIKYLAFYAKYPSVEYIMKLGLGRLIATKLNGEAGMNVLYYRGKSLQKVLRMPLSKIDVSDLKKAADTIREDTLFLWQISKKENVNARLSGLMRNAAIEANVDKIVKLHKVIGSLEKIIRYYEKNIKGYRIGDRHSSVPEYIFAEYFFCDWIDYFDACKKLQFDMSDESILFPKDLRTAHNNAVKQVELIKNAPLDAKIKLREKKTQMFKFSSGDLVAVPAASSGELIAEGKTLHHCVGLYAEKYAAGTTNIIFIRQADSLERPFFTMEVNNKNEVVQVRGNHNRPATPEVVEFVDAFKKNVLQVKRRQAK